MRSGSASKESIESKMAEWLAHPLEFGVPPRSVRFKRTYRGKLITYGNVEIHLVEYEMPNGKKGRGFVNGSLTWSFLGEGVNTIGDTDLVIAYCGWAWLFPALQSGSVLTSFPSLTEEANLIRRKQKEGLENFEITGRYKIDTSELFEFTATKQGKAIRGAGDASSDITFEANDPRFALPSIYFLLGSEAIESMS